MTPTWYDLLGVERDATADEIRAAWKGATADLDPGTRLRTLNEAAEVLLDPDRRADYDATIDTSDEAAPVEAPVEEPVTRQKLTKRVQRAKAVSDGSPETEAQAVARLETDQAPDSRTGTAGEEATDAEPTRSDWTPPTWLLALLAVLAALALTAVGYLVQQPSDDAIAKATREGQAAAETSTPVILAYDFRDMDASQKAADALLTSGYRKEYDKLFSQLKENADQVKPVVTAKVVASGVIRASADRVQVLVLVDRDTVNVQGNQPTSHDQVRVTLVKDGDDWLVDKMDTQPLPQ